MRWGGIFDIDAKLIEITNEEEKTFAPDFWNNAKEAELLVKNLRSKKKWVEDYNKGIALCDELQLAYEFYKEGELSEAELDEQYALTNTHLEDLEFKNMLTNGVHVILQLLGNNFEAEGGNWNRKEKHWATSWLSRQCMADSVRPEIDNRHTIHFFGFQVEFGHKY